MATRDSTRQRLLDAADALVFVHGIAATPVDQVLERAGCSPATLYRAYGSKEGLVAAALERRHADWLSVWDEAVAAAEDDRGRLLAVFDALDTFRARPEGARWCAFLGTAAEYPDPPAELASALGAESASLHERLRELAAPVAGSGSERLAEALVLVVSGELAVRLRRTSSSPGTGRAVAAQLVDLAAARD